MSKIDKPNKTEELKISKTYFVDRGSKSYFLPEWFVIRAVEVNFLKIINKKTGQVEIIKNN